MKPPKVSIVTISFNQAEFLERTIRSVISQTGVELDYVIADPGSTDGSRELIQQYREYFSHTLLEPDQGPADGLNRAFSLASGDIFGFINSDDTLLPGALERVSTYFDRHPDIDVVCGHGLIIDRHDHVLRKVWSTPYSGFRAAYGVSQVIQQSSFFRRSAYDRTKGFNIDNRTSWDGELFADMFLSGARFGVIDDFLSCFRLHGSSITNSTPVAAAKFRKDADRRFELLMGRKRRPIDDVVARGVRLFHHATHPRATYERIKRGPIGNRGVD